MADEIDPREALASIHEARAGVARSMDYPFGWDILFGLIVAAMVMGQGLPQISSALVLLGSLAGLFWMVKWWRDRFGWWVNAYAPKRARWVMFAMWPLLLGCMGLSWWTRFFDGPSWAPLVAGALTFVITIVFGRWWMSVYRRELAEGGQ
jgi:L-lactate permease